MPLDKNTDWVEFFRKEFEAAALESPKIKAYKEFVEKYGPGGSKREEIMNEIISGKTTIESKIEELKRELPEELHEPFVEAMKSVISSNVINICQNPKK